MTARRFAGLAENEKRREYVVLTGVFQKEGRNWVATIIETGTTAQARTIPELMERLNEAVDLHLSTLEAVGELERFLSEQGMAVYKFEPKTRASKSKASRLAL